MLTLAQLLDLVALAGLQDQQGQFEDRRRTLELGLYQSGVSPAQIGSVTGEPTHRVRRRIQRRLGQARS